MNKGSCQQRINFIAINSLFGKIIARF